MRIVAMGGGTGLSTLLQGLKKYVAEDRTLGQTLPSRAAADPALWVSDLAAVVTVSDDGGSSGRLRRDFRVLPPGDIRNCLVALSEDEALLSHLFQFRFPGGRGLKGHSFGNLFLTALTGVTGDFQEALRVSGEVLAIRGRIYPSTMSDIRLEATLENGRTVQGETRISRSRRRIARLHLVPSPCQPLPQTLEAIEQADAITVGPGSLFTSLIPNFLVEGVACAIQSSRAAKIYICNLMTQPGESAGFSASDHVRGIYEHCGFPLFDYVLLNTAPISPRLRERYRTQKSRPVANDVPELEKFGLRVVTEDLVSADRSSVRTTRWVRHDPDRLASAVIGIAAAHIRTEAPRRAPAARPSRRAGRKVSAT